MGNISNSALSGRYCSYPTVLVQAFPCLVLKGVKLFYRSIQRGMHGPKERLEDFSGQLQCDGYKVYVSIANKRKDISLISCLAHIRRKFFDAQKHHPTLAQYGLKEIQKLYAIERACTEAGYTTEQRQEN